MSTVTDIELSKKEQILLDDERAPDWLLALLVKFANRDVEFRMGITLTVHGMLVSGQLISGQRYADEMVQVLRTRATGEGAESMTVVWSELRKHYDETDVDSGDEPDESDEPNESDDDEWEPNPSYIHLTGARYWQNGRYMGDGQMPWRGRLAAVDGFFLGELSPAE